MSIENYPAYVGHVSKVIWYPVEEKPNIKEGSYEFVILGFITPERKKIVYGGAYLNESELYDEELGEDKEWTGFYDISKHYDCDEYFEPVEDTQYRTLKYWAYFPELPGK